MPLWEAGFAGMPSNLWVSLESPYQRCPSRYNAISRSVTISQNMQLIFLTCMDSFHPFLVRLFCSREPVFLPFPPRVGPLSPTEQLPRSRRPQESAPSAPRPAPRGRRPQDPSPQRIGRPKEPAPPGSAAPRSRRPYRAAVGEARPPLPCTPDPEVR